MNLLTHLIRKYHFYFSFTNIVVEASTVKFRYADHMILRPLHYIEPQFASLKLNYPYMFISVNKTTPSIKSLLNSPKGGFTVPILQFPLSVPLLHCILSCFRQQINTSIVVKVTLHNKVQILI